MRADWRASLAWAPAVLVGALAAWGVFAQARQASDSLKESPSGIARGADEARRELRGDAYADALAEAAARIPAGTAYAIADEDGPGPDKNWVRCDLAPRVPVLMRPGRCGDWYFDRPQREIPAMTVVVARDGGVRLAQTRSLLTSLWSGLTGLEQDIPGWIDEPGEGATVTGGFLVGGWCQERGGRPCPAVRVWLDGHEVDAARVERFPRPDVEAAVSGIGDCSRAGWHVSFAAGELASGRHCVAAALIAVGGGHRRVGPWAFTVTR